ncbi:hypothetical protein HPB49_012249 [Dermacentor silvarum]|uniref:Uncharacterized protein n=1 Tax=Dermacentor silvarum TaxID=543639 RepID=A0ACB8C3I3_DERSI|nr:hypothetical protein HPB49_012249 [Dermacentor silvarum]
MSSPPENHQCVRKCPLCGKEDLTRDKKCTMLFRTPYIVKKRKWEAKLAVKQEEKAPKTALSTREEASSRPEQQSKSSQKSAPPNSQVGWVDNGSQDSSMVKVLKKENRLMQEHIRTMQAQYNNMQ